MAMQVTRRFGVNVFGCRIDVASSCSDGQALLDRLVFPSLPRAEFAGDSPDFSILIEKVEGEVRLLANDALVAVAGHADELAAELIRVLDEAVIARMKGVFAVHAGAVEWCGRALLLPGATHAGKSSLVAELLRRGATYFSDEYALIDAEGRVHPYPRPLLLRNGRPNQIPASPEDCGSQAGRRPAPVGWVVALRYHAGARWAVDPIPQSEALVTLLRNTPHEWERSPDLLGVFGRAVAGATCLAGQRGEAAEAAAAILRLASVSAAGTQTGQKQRLSPLD